MPILDAVEGDIADMDITLLEADGQDDLVGGLVHALEPFLLGGF